MQTSDGYTCPSKYILVTTPSVELDPAAVVRRLLETGIESIVSHDPHEVFSQPSDSHRNLQLSVIDTTNTLVKSNSSMTTVVQIYFLKNRRSVHDPEIYSKVQNVVINDLFYSTLGNILKDYPQVIQKTPLISLQFFSQTLEKTMKIYNIKDMTKIQLTELKIGSEGYLYCMILPQDSSNLTRRNLMGLHIKYGIDINNMPAVWKRTYLVNDPNWIIYFNIDDLPMTGNPTKYTFYYYATDKRIDELAGSTTPKSMDFTIWNPTSTKSSRLPILVSVLLMCLTWIQLL